MKMRINPLAVWLGEVPAHWEFYRAKYIFAHRITVAFSNAALWCNSSESS